MMAAAGEGRGGSSTFGAVIGGSGPAGAMAAYQQSMASSGMQGAGRTGEEGYRMGGQGDYQQMLSSPNDNIMEQYQRCGQFNNEQLKNARNLEELVAIDIQSVDGALAANAAF